MGSMRSILSGQRLTPRRMPSRERPNEAAFQARNTRSMEQQNKLPALVRDHLSRQLSTESTTASITNNSCATTSLNANNNWNAASSSTNNSLVSDEGQALSS